MKISIGTLGIIGILLIILKLTNTINWSWWIILIPFYPVTLFCLFWFLVVLFFGYQLKNITIK